MTSPILVTGGAGFIGSNFILHWMEREQAPVVNFDKLTYAGNLGNLSKVACSPRHLLVRGHIPAAGRGAVPARAPAAGHHQLRGRESRGPLHSRAGGVHPHERERDLYAARRSARLLV